MRSSLLFFPFALLASPALAQTALSITAADMPVVGDSLRLSQASPLLPTSAPPLSRAGANQTWDYTGLTAIAQRVVRYTNVSTAAGPLLQLTFNNAFFGPDTRATLVSPQSLPAAAGALPIADPLEFSAVSGADYRLVGYGGTLNGTAVPVTYASRAQQDVIYRFPLTYGGAAQVSNSLLTTPAALASSGYFSQKRRRTTQPDAWGTITTRFGTFQALRVVTTLADHDSLALGGVPGQGLTLPLVREYKWLAQGVHVPVLTITTATTAGNEVVTSVEYRDVFRRFVGLATHSAAAEAGLSAYPNPSAVGTGLRLAVPAGGGSLTIAGTDLLGRQLFSRAYTSSAGGTVVLDAATLGAFRGVLLLTVTSAQGTATRRLVRQ
jgi:hypothetical protein